MLYIPKISDYLQILTDKEVKDSVVKSFNAESKLIMRTCSSDDCVCDYNIEILNPINPES